MKEQDEASADALAKASLGFFKRFGSESAKYGTYCTNFKLTTCPNGPCPSKTAQSEPGTRGVTRVNGPAQIPIVKSDDRINETTLQTQMLRGE